MPRLPSRIDTLEWFFSPADLIRVMDWLRKNSEGDKGKDARALLSKNPGIMVEKGQYAWVGFKGGSEPGVINLTWLARNQAGEWYAITGGWNNPAAAVEEARFMTIMSRALALTRRARP